MLEAVHRDNNGRVLTVISPAKSLDFESPLATRKHTLPTMLDRSSELVSVMVEKSPDDLQTLMGISRPLAEANFERFQDWDPTFTPKNARPAVLAFAGDVYLGMEASTFSERDFTHAQKTLRILSGLYGLLRPLDLMQPYRLEMGTRLATSAGANLYEFWGDTITHRIQEDVAASPGTAALVNLASNEYFGAVRGELLDARVISPVFLDAKADGDYRIVSFFAKRARGAMAGWMIRERIKSVRALTEFDGMGYRYSADRSRPDTPTFVRRDGGC